jgi:hypothetical protein
MFTNNPSESSEDIVFPAISWQYRQFFKEKCTKQNGRAESSLEYLLLPKSKKQNFNPMSFHLAKIDWSIFGTATFEDDKFTKNTKQSEDLRQKEFFNLMWSICRKFDLRLRNLVYFGKSEFGAGGRGHFNFLIGRRGTEKINSEILAASLQEFWTTGDGRRGGAKIEPFNKGWTLEGVLYQSKYEFDNRGEWRPPNEIFSPMLKKIIIKSARNN